MDIGFCLFFSLLPYSPFLTSVSSEFARLLPRRPKTWSLASKDGHGRFGLFLSHKYGGEDGMMGKKTLE